MQTSVGAEWGAHRPSLAGSLLIGLSRNTVFGRGLLRKVTSRLFDRVHAGPVDCKLWGASVRLYPARNRTDRKAAMRPDHLDRRELVFLRARMAQPGAVFVDVGANSGLYSLCAALHAAPGARIVAFEPVSEVLARLSFNVDLARAAGRIEKTVEVHAVNTAVGNADGQALLTMTRSEGTRSLVQGTGQPVPLRRLAGVLDEYGVTRIDVMKIDVEGYEDRVLSPYLASVGRDRWPRAIIIEHVHRHLWNMDCLGDCAERGYRQVLATRNNALLEL